RSALLNVVLSSVSVPPEFKMIGDTPAVVEDGVTVAVAGTRLVLTADMTGNASPPRAFWKVTIGFAATDTTTLLAPTAGRLPSSVWIMPLVTDAVPAPEPASPEIGFV